MTAEGSSNKTQTKQAEPPNDAKAEACLLGAAMLHHSALEVLATKTEPKDFYVPNHRHIATALRLLYEAGNGADVIDVSDELRKAGVSDETLDPALLVTLVAESLAPSGAERWATIIHDKATMRRMHMVSINMAELALSNPPDAHVALGEAMSWVSDVASQNGSRTYSSLDVPDTAKLFAGDHELEQPKWLCRDDNQALLYPGKMHVFQAEPSTGKSWLALVAAMEVMDAKDSVLYIDYEDSAQGIIDRLKSLRATSDIAPYFQYVRPHGAMDHAEKAIITALYDKFNPELIIIDGVAEALSRDGYDEDKNTDVVKWVDAVPRWLASKGACVLMLDHVAKNKETRGRHARGASHKLAAVDGASYEIQVEQPFSRTKDGSVKLKIAKDRPGGVGEIGAVAARAHFHVKGNGNTMDITVTPDYPKPGEDNEGGWFPTKAMAAVSAHLEKVGSAQPLDRIQTSVDYTKQIVSQATHILVAHGFLSSDREGRRAEVYHFVKPYVEGQQVGPKKHEQQVLDGTDELAAKRSEKGK